MRSVLVFALVVPMALVGCSGSSSRDDGGGEGGSVLDDGRSPSETEAGGGTTDGASTAEGGGPTGGPVGSPCDSDDDCTDPPDAECFTTEGGGMVPTITFPGGFCSKPCSTGGGGGEGDEEEATDCGSIGTCASFSMSGSQGGSMTMSFCTIRCDKPEDCRVDEGYRCHFILPGLPGVCTIP